MPPLVKILVKKLKLTYLFVMRIMLAPNHFGIPFWRRLPLAIPRGFVPDQWVIYDLKHNPPSDYLSEFDWYRSRWINAPFDPMLNNKVVCAELLQDRTRVPATLFIKNKGRFISYADPRRLAHVSDAVRTVEAHGSVFMKPIAAGKGIGVHRIEFTGNQYLVDSVVTGRDVLAKLLTSQDGWFFSEFIEQHPALAQIYPKTTNTIRLITLREPDTGLWKAFFAVLRIGTEATIPVDNGSQGGLVAQIDMRTGTLSEARSLRSLDSYPVHPNSGATIEGVSIPDWQNVVAHTLELAESFPYMHFIAWDILLTSAGPCVIEANTSSGINIIQLWGPQRNGELGDFYRAHRVIG